MAESLKKKEGTKDEIYKSLIPQIKSLVEDEEDLIANLSNTVAVLKEAFDFLWVGFYFVKGDDLVLGPFQGPLACTRIRYGKGVCGTAWKEARTLVVPDVEAFPGHIACSSLSRSEIVVPLKKEGVIWGVLDIDSAELNTFDEIDKQHLEHLSSILANLFLSIIL
ncbi:GAF domain-containing protein [uncultured Bacteroides sp.]|uniref:GAF domain-containing protein n=1 Tax=uncultured Bacteroides sp. TaxID=162156 RepID=UPI002AABC926|nr:GAF domain-containing protein [uncultured Bacteroides sp.]